jgi:hypothetical protein
MKFNLDDFLEIKDDSPEESELRSLSTMTLDLYILNENLKEGNQVDFYDKLIDKIGSFKNEYILKKKNQNAKCYPQHKCLYMFYDLYNQLLKKTFMNNKFLMTFLHKRIYYFYDSIHVNNPNVKIINDSILSLCKNQITPIITHCLNLIVNKFIFQANLTDYDYLLKFFMDDLKSYSKVYDMSKKTTEIFFVQLICLDDYKNREDTLNNFNDENVAKYFIEKQINIIYNIHKY